MAQVNAQLASDNCIRDILLLPLHQHNRYEQRSEPERYADTGIIRLCVRPAAVVHCAEREDNKKDNCQHCADIDWDCVFLSVKFTC